MARRPKAPPRTREADKPLSDREQRFVAEYLKDYNGARAARACGYSPRTAKEQAHDLLTKPHLQAALGRAAKVILAAAEIDAVELRRRLASIVRRNMKRYYEADGQTLKPIHELSDEYAEMIMGSETIVKNINAGDGHVDTIHKLKLDDKKFAFDILSRDCHVGDSTVAVVTNDAAIYATLQRAHKRMDVLRAERAKKALAAGPDRKALKA